MCDEEEEEEEEEAAMKTAGARTEDRQAEGAKEGEGQRSER